MNTPVCDFVRAYREKNGLRLHMPGHKGRPFLGAEPFDLTEIQGADSLYEADGVIRESEENASRLFGCKTFYSTEGSTQCIKAMVYLAVLAAKRQGKRPLIAAGRNAHRAFVAAAALMDCDVRWLYPGPGENYLSCCPSPEEVEAFLQKEKPAALYLTSPDYLGHMPDVAGIAGACKRQGVLLMVDNAHGAYLRFLQPSLHPMDLGADLCCDSAHKTLPVLTGGAYLHLNCSMQQAFPPEQVKKALSLFGSTSPSYLILQSLDLANPYLEGHALRLQGFLQQAQQEKERLIAAGYALLGQEPMKWAIAARAYGYTGQEMADALRRNNMECEFCDPDHLVLMLAPELGEEGLHRLTQALLSLPKKQAVALRPPAFSPPERVLSIRQAVMAPGETLPVEACLGRVLAGITVGCPPAVPILVSGERITMEAMACFRYYGITHVDVVRKDFI